MKKLVYFFAVLFSISFTHAQTAVQPPGSGTESNPYLISTLDHLYWLSQTVSEWDKYYRQTADIDASLTITWDGGKGFSPIGGYSWNNDHRFTGIYDGDFFKISNLYINRPDTGGIALFGLVFGHDIPRPVYLKNIILENVNITGGYSVGAVAGHIDGANITACSSTGTILADSAFTGGLVGILSSGNLTYSFSEVNVTANKHTAGGLVGMVTDTGSIKYSYALGNVTAVDGAAGGLIGANYAYGNKVSNSFARGNVQAPTWTGGFVGEITSNNNYENCYSTGSVTGTTFTGGFSGKLFGPATVTNCFWDIESSGWATSSAGTGKTTAEMKTQSTFTSAGWDFTDFWLIDGTMNNGYPDFFWVIPPGVPVLTYPVNASVGQPLTPKMKWNYSALSARFRIEIASDITFHNIIYVISTANVYKNIPPGVLSNNTVYYWRVRGIKSFGAWARGTASEERSFRVIDGSVTKPTLSYPVGGAVTYLHSQDLFWYVSTGGLNYTYEIELSAGPNDFESYPFHSFTSAVSNFHIPFELAGSTTYYWRVRSYNAQYDLYSAFSPLESFRTDVSLGAVVPNITYPSGGVTVYSQRPVLYWYTGAAPSGITFIMQYSTTADFSNNVLIATGFSETHFQTLLLYEGETYYWRVKSVYNGVQSEYSTVGSFVVYENTSSSPVVPAASYPTGGNLTYNVNPRLYWYLNSYVSGLQYRVQYRKEGEAYGASYETDQLYLQLSNLLPGTLYYWRVQSYNLNGSSAYCNEVSFRTTESAGIAAPQLSYPAGGTIVYTTAPVLNWWMNSYLGVDHYQVKISFNEDLSDPFLVSGAVTETSFALSNLVPGAVYYWAVTAFDGSGNHTASLTESFIINPGTEAPITPVNGSPKDGTVITKLAPELSWFAPVTTGGLTYELQYSKDEDFSSSNEIQNITIPVKKITGLESGVKYYWRVRSVKNGIPSHYSAKSFFIPVSTPTSVKEQGVIPLKFTVEQNYPNPFNPVTKINFGIAKESYVTIKVYNTMGQEVKTLFSENKIPGSYSVEWNGENSSGDKVTSGIYLYKVTAGGETKTLKMILLK